jgi:hypothetical protein
MTPRLMSGVVLAAPSSKSSCDPDRPPPTLKSDLKKLRPSSWPPPLPKLAPNVTPAVRPTSASGSRYIERKILDRPGIHHLADRRGGRLQYFGGGADLYLLGRVAHLQVDLQFHHIVHLEGDRTLLGGLEARQ